MASKTSEENGRGTVEAEESLNTLNKSAHSIYPKIRDSLSPLPRAMLALSSVSPRYNPLKPEGLVARSLFKIRKGSSNDTVTFSALRAARATLALFSLRFSQL